MLLVHRPRYEDWSFPKGKLELGETSIAAAVREVEEETGLRVRIGAPLPDDHYEIAGGQPKVVNYWTAVPPKDADISTYASNAEIDDLRWMPVSKASRKLSYDHDGELLEAFASSAFDSTPLIIIRHAHAHSRKDWQEDDSIRPLESTGKDEAERLVPVLQAYGITRVISSDAVRCVDTMVPFVKAAGARLKLDPAISEDGYEVAAMRKRVTSALSSSKRIAICSHRPVLPDVFDALGIDPVSLKPGGLVVVHRKAGSVVSLEPHPDPL